MILARRVGILVSDPVSWIIVGGWREAVIEVMGFRNLASSNYSIGTEECNYALCLIQGRGHFVSDIVIQLISARPGISILGVETGRHSKTSKYLLPHSVIQGFSVSSLRHCDVGEVTRSPFILINNIK